MIPRALPLLAFLPLAAAAFGCARVDDVTQARTPVVSAARVLDPSAASTPRVGDVRVLSGRVNLREPLRVNPDGDGVTVTFGVGPRAGATVALDPQSLEARQVTPFAYPSHSASTPPAYLPITSTRVSLEGGGMLECWNDQESSRILAQAYDASGAPRGEQIAIPVEARHAFGAPHAATVDGRHVVVAFFASDETGFALVAASVDVPAAQWQDSRPSKTMATAF